MGISVTKSIGLAYTWKANEKNYVKVPFFAFFYFAFGGKRATQRRVLLRHDLGRGLYSEFYTQTYNGIQFRILALFSATYVVAKKARTAVKTARMGMVNPNVSHFVTKKKSREKVSLTHKLTSEVKPL